MKLDNKKIEFIINCDIEEMASLLQEEYGMDLLKAFDTIYNSKIYQKLTTLKQVCIYKVHCIYTIT